MSTTTTALARALAAEKAERDKEAAVAANVAHRRTINREAAADLVASGLTEDAAKDTVTWIAEGNVRHISISY